MDYIGVTNNKGFIPNSFKHKENKIFITSKLLKKSDYIHEKLFLSVHGECS